MLHQSSRKDPLDANYRPISVLPPVSNIFEMLMQKKNKKEKGFGGADLIDLSKAFDTINHEVSSVLCCTLRQFSSTPKKFNA